MINGDVNMFVEDLHYGECLAFVYDNRAYITEGSYSEKDKKANLWVATTDNKEPKINYDFNKETIYDCAEEFLKTPMFNGKTFWEVEQEIEWTDF